MPKHLNPFTIALMLLSSALIFQNCGQNPPPANGSRTILKSGSNLTQQSTEDEPINLPARDGQVVITEPPPPPPLCPDGQLKLTVELGRGVRQKAKNHWRCDIHLDSPGCEVTVTSNLVPDEILLDAEYGEGTGHGPSAGGRWSASITAGTAAAKIALADFFRSSVDWNNSVINILGRKHDVTRQLSRDRKQVGFTLIRAPAGGTVNVGYKVSDKDGVYVDKIETGGAAKDEDLKIFRLSFGSNDSRNPGPYPNMDADLLIKRLRVRAKTCVTYLEQQL